MKLRHKVFLWMLVAGVVPIGAVGALAHQTLRGRTQDQYARQLDAAVAAAQRRVRERGEQDRRAVDRLCEPDFLVDRVLLDLAADRFGPARQNDLVQELPSVMDSLNLDVLSLVDGRDGRVLAAGHYPGRAGAVDRELLEDGRRAGEAPFVRDVRSRQGGETREGAAWLRGCFAQRDDVRVLVVGGRYLETVVADLATDLESVRMVLTGPDGVLPADVPSGREPRDVGRFERADGTPAARLRAAVDDSALQEQLEEQSVQLAIGAGIAFAIALLLSGVLSISVTRPLAQLEDAARRVGAGDLESTIGVRSSGEVASALGAFNKMTRDLRRTQEKLLRAERIAAWRDIARSIAHEIKNPLSPIQVSIETMQKTYRKKHPDFDEIFWESTSTILEEVERLRRIVTEFSHFARMPRPRPESVSVADVVGHVVGLHQGGPVRIDLDDPGGLSPIRADREQITQVLVNLVQNAADAAEAVHGTHGGRVRVVLEESTEPAGVRIRVQDNGPGIAPEDRLRVFEPYFTTKAEGKGTGLGLAIVHRIVSEHGGSIELAESPLGGAEILVLLPESGPPPEAEISMTDTAVPLVNKR